MNWPSTEISLFGLPTVLPLSEARETRDYLQLIWSAQSRKGPRALRQVDALDSVASTSLATLQNELRLMKHWFDPVASGKRLRELVAEAPDDVIDPKGVHADTGVVQLGDGRVLVNLEGRAVLWVLSRSLQSVDGRGRDSTIVLPIEDCLFAIGAVEATYRDWTQAKIIAAAQLMVAETSTLRPSAAGLLLFLLLNRHTSEDRALHLPTDPGLSNSVSDAIAGPVLAFAKNLSGASKASDRGVDLYRGWALGEIQRRLGADLRRSRGRLWIAEEAIGKAIDRLSDAIWDRLGGDPEQIRRALEATLDAYETSRSRLSSLGIAYERPGNTARLFRELTVGSAARQPEDGTRH